MVHVTSEFTFSPPESFYTALSSALSQSQSQSPHPQAQAQAPAEDNASSSQQPRAEEKEQQASYSSHSLPLPHFSLPTIHSTTTAANMSSPQQQASSATTPQQRLALHIIDFLNKSLSDGTVPADDRESLEIATSCIADSFKVDATAAASPAAAGSQQSLLQIYTAYEALKSATAATSSAAQQQPKKEPTDEEKKQAEGLKSKGNAAMASKDYVSAIKLYTEALSLHPGNAIFLSNRAAAHSAARDHESARADAEAAVAADPKYTKAWSRLGLARFALGDPKGAMEAYGKGIEHEGNGGSEAMKKGYETAKKRVEEVEAEGGASDSPTTRSSPGGGAGGAGGMPDLGSLASMLGGGGGGAGAGGGAGGGMDFSSIMSNPMFQNMAQSLMSNPDMMSNLMGNPRLREMASQFSSGGGMPDLGAMMSDPSIAEMARSMMGGGGGAGAPGSGSGPGAAPGGGGGGGAGAGAGQ